MLRVVFMGTPEFALPSLEAVLRSGHKIVGVVTQPDRPKGRGKKLTPPPVKVWALERDLTVFQPEKVKNPEFITLLRELAPDIIITAASAKSCPKIYLIFHLWVVLTYMHPCCPNTGGHRLFSRH